MGGISSAIGSLASIGSAVSGVASVATPFIRDAQTSRIARQMNATQQAQAEADARLRAEQNRVQTEIAESDRRAALKRAVARQRALFSAQGIGSDGGSSEAVLLGLVNESETERDQRSLLDNLRDRTLNQNLDQQRQLNLLQQNQLQERQRLRQITGLLG
jgi:hypothetical protein